MNDRKLNLAETISQNFGSLALDQGSQTQIDSGAASDLKKDLAGRIKKRENNYLLIFIKKTNELIE